MQRYAAGRHTSTCSVNLQTADKPAAAHVHYLRISGRSSKETIMSIQAGYSRRGKAVKRLSLRCRIDPIIPRRSGSDGPVNASQQYMVARTATASHRRHPRHPLFQKGVKSVGRTILKIWSSYFCLKARHFPSRFKSGQSSSSPVEKTTVRPLKANPSRKPSSCARQAPGRPMWKGSAPEARHTPDVPRAS